MKILLTQASKHELAVEAVQAACGAMGDTIQALLPFTFAVTQHLRTRWWLIHIDKADYVGDDETTERINELRTWIRRQLGYERHCNRCNEQVDDITFWICPKCGCNEWRISSNVEDSSEASDGQRDTV